MSLLTKLLIILIDVNDYLLFFDDNYIVFDIYILYLINLWYTVAFYTTI